VPLPDNGPRSFVSMETKRGRLVGEGVALGAKPVLPRGTDVSPIVGHYFLHGIPLTIECESVLLLGLARTILRFSSEPLPDSAFSLRLRYGLSHRLRQVLDSRLRG